MRKIYKLLVLSSLLVIKGIVGADAQTTTYTATGAVQTYTVPAGVTSIAVDLKGAAGGGVACASTYQSPGGCGAHIKATLTVTPGHVLNIIVGKQGSGTGAGGYGGGGTDHAFIANDWPGAGGGGGTFVTDITAGDTLAVAGGGGGGGGDICSNDAGGSGGALIGVAGNSEGCGVGGGGGGGTLTAGGAGTTCFSDASGSGTLGTGGSYPASGFEGSGGGGGGRYGGGAGSSGGGGGGGSSYVNLTYGVINADTAGTNCSADGLAIISIPCTGPTGVTASVSSPSVCAGSSLTLTGTATGATSYSWTGPGGYTSTLESPVIPSIAEGNGGIYTFTAYNATLCPTYTTASVTVSNPIVPVVTPSVATVCNGGNVTITTTVTPTLSNLFPTESWESGVPSSAGSIVDGWGYIGGTSGYWFQTLGTSAGFPTIGSAEAGSYVAEFNSFSIGSGQAATLYSPSFSLTGITSPTLTFWVYRDVSAYNTTTYNNEGFSVYINTTASTTGTTLLGKVPRRGGQAITGPLTGTSTTTTSGWFQYTATIPATFTGATNYILFTALSKFGDNCYLDNVQLTGYQSTAAPLWSPATYLFTDAAFTTPYTTGTATNTVYMHPTGVATTTVETYTASVANDSGCNAANTSIVTIYDPSATISGGGTICSGGTPSVTITGPAGAAVSYNINGGSTLTAIVGAGGTVVLTPGPVYASATYNILSIITGSCSAALTGSAVVTVTPPTHTIAGDSSICVGFTQILSGTPSGGTWSSGTGSVATVNALSGIVTGLDTGSSIITYAAPTTGCISITTATVNPSPSPISASTLCQGATAPAPGESYPGGTWSITPSTIATVDSISGTVTGIGGGGAILTYTLPAGCFVTSSVTINPLPAAITGADSVCVGLTTTLGDTSTTLTVPGIWSSSDPTIASITGAGGTATGSLTEAVAGVSAGTVTITYTLQYTGCLITTTLTVNPSPAPITGPSSVCAEYTIPLSVAPTTGGTWSSAPTSFGTIDPVSGVLTGLSAGTTIVTYTLPAGQCVSTYPVLVNALPTPVTGPDSVCAGLTITLGSTPATGTWTSAPSSVATIDPTTGIVTGIGAGMSDITYTLGTGCYINDTIKVNPSPTPITGPTAVCAEYTDTLSDLPTTGGTWSNAPTGFATIDPLTGILTGISAGTTLVTYTLPPGQCTATYSVLVNPLPSAITGPDSVCAALTITLHSTPTTGTWTSAPSSVATIDPTTGIVTGIGAGMSDITYTLGTGCYVNDTIKVNPAPSPITGPTAVCATTSIALSDTPTTGGTWSTSPTTFATIDPITGVLAGLSGGTTIVTYTLPPGQCTATYSVLVNDVPSPITGADSVCVGLTTALSSAPTPGTWSNAPSGFATIDPVTGILTGISQGVTEVTYTLPTGCLDSVAVTVNPLPDTIAGLTAVCTGLSITLTDDTLGGTWSATPASVGTINSSGILTGTLSGPVANTVLVTYTIPTGCIATSNITVNPLPAPIGGADTVCFGLTTTLTDAVGPGTWSSSDTTVAKINAGGTVTGVSVGSATITYTLGTGCIETMLFTVNPLPLPITGPAEVCVNASIPMSDVTSPGTWSTAPTSIATIDPISGSLTGVSAGNVTVIFTLPTTCAITNTVTVNPIPNPIGGTFAACEDGGTAIVTETTPPGPGTWSITPAGTASISATGTVTGEVAGAATVTYTLPVTGCYVTQSFTVNPLPAPITGTPTVCANSTVTLHDATTPGTWSAAPPTVATISTPGGVLGGISSGTATVTYTLGTGCDVTYTVTVDPQPAAVITPLGDTMICTGSFVALTANTGAGLSYQWSDPGAIPGATASTYIASVTGNYKVKVTNTFGCSLTSPTMAVSTHDVGTVTISSGGATTTCAGTPLNLVVTLPLVAGLSYQWELNGVPIPGANANSYNVTDSSGNYDVVVSNTTGCSSTSNIIAVTVNPAPAGNATASGVLSFCTGGSVTLTADTGTGYTYQWYGMAAGAIGGANGISYTATTTDVYYVQETGPDGCNALSAGITVDAIAGANTTITPAGATVFCAGGSVLLTVPAVAGNLYQWYNGGTAIAGATNATYTDTLSGSFTVAITNVAGCTDTTATAQVVTSVPVPLVVPLTPASFCWGGGVTLTVNVVSGTGALTYQWYLDGTPITGATSPIYNTSTPGDYTCTISGSCITATAPVTVIENPLPNPVISSVSGQLETGNYYVTYQWYENTVGIPGATTATITPTSDGNYAVAVTDTNGCQSVSDVYVLTSLGISNVNQVDVKIYPNPAQTMVHIVSTSDLKANMSSIDGKILITQEHAHDIDISSLADGVYMITLYDTNGVLVKTDKLIKVSN